MPNRKLLIIVFFLLPLLRLNAERLEAENLSDLLLSLNLPVDEVGLNPGIYYQKMSEENLQMMRSLLTKVGSGDKKANESEPTVIGAAIRIIAFQKNIDDFALFDKLLDNETQRIRLDAAQALAGIGGNKASERLESAARASMKKLNADDPLAQYEPVDLVRCTLLASQKDERAKVFQRLLKDMQDTLGANTSNARQAENIFREILMTIDQQDITERNNVPSVDTAQSGNVISRKAAPEVPLAETSAVAEVESSSRFPIVFIAIFGVSIIGVVVFLLRRKSR